MGLVGLRILAGASRRWRFGRKGDYLCMHLEMCVNSMTEMEGAQWEHRTVLNSCPDVSGRWEGRSEKRRWLPSFYVSW